jgi:AcrR family transcriptional regulator
MDAVATAQRGNLQSKKQDLVRHEIWHAAIDLFFLEGFDQVTVDQIAERAGVSRRTFFRYFSSKDDLMGSTMKAFGEALEQMIRSEAASLSAFEVAKRSVAQVLMCQPSSTVTERVVQISKRSSAALSAQFLQLPVVEENLARAFAIRAGRVDEPSIDDRILASVTFAATKLCVDLWVGEPKRPVNEIVEDVFARLSATCATREKGRKK